MIMMKDANSVQFISLFPDDGRDVNSFYTSISQDPQKAVIFLFAVESDGLLLQAVDNAARDPVGKNMCASALRPCIMNVVGTYAGCTTQQSEMVG